MSEYMMKHMSLIAHEFGSSEEHVDNVILGKGCVLVHAVLGSDSSPTGFSVHTHGVELGIVGGYDLEIVLPMPPTLAIGIIAKSLEACRMGKLKFGVAAQGILQLPFAVYPIKAFESGRIVRRLIMPDPEGHLDAGGMLRPFDVQYSGTS